VSYFESDWCSLPWSSWVSFQASRKDWGSLPVEQGLYRVRPAGEDFLVYIGETGRCLRNRLNSLRRGALSDSMPFNDPHTAAPNLWAWRQEEHFEYECSASVFLGPATTRKSLECLLLWKYRLEKGDSTLCNYGRFHKNYIKSTNRSEGKRGYRLSDDKENASGGQSSTPLKTRGNPTDHSWMGLNWSKPKTLTSEQVKDVIEASALYRIMSADGQNIVYIGESNSLRSRLTQHCRNFRNQGHTFSFVAVGENIAKFQLHELETDLIAAHYDQTKSSPKFQFQRPHQNYLNNCRAL
jgi:hypothetical protein